ncbi:MAG: hypothetical protein RMY16_13840 [Nostoc sp. DedQUE12b]|uniref:hypothetical protein n=1 Tax=Nostoc sp. DedQUE12b TaxID=3075398 RepID=UPI002AD4E88B|nr:hypothetical protein [Nostoc sp. DedQUE12b]MDZ8086617.1 hypothetical protein [Nostoc sp. DedQUE12b]
MEATVTLTDEYLVRLAIKIKTHMGIKEFIPFKEMDQTQIQEWIINANTIIPGIFIKELPNFPHTVKLK